jgi:hypothetical protein
MVVTLTMRPQPLLHHDGRDAARKLVGGHEVGVHHVLHDLVAGLPELGRRRPAIEIGADVRQREARIVDEDVHAAGVLRGLHHRIAVG